MADKYRKITDGNITYLFKVAYEDKEKMEYALTALSDSIAQERKQFLKWRFIWVAFWMALFYGLYWFGGHCPEG